MATHTSVFAWRIPWTEEAGGLQSIGLWRVGHDLGDLAHTHTHSRLRAERYRPLHLGSLALWFHLGLVNGSYRQKNQRVGGEKSEYFFLFASAPLARVFHDFGSCQAAPLPWFQFSLDSAELLFSPCPWRPRSNNSFLLPSWKLP